MDVELTITENHDDITLEVSESGDEITLTVEEAVENVQITIVEGGSVVDEDYPTYANFDAAFAAGLGVGDKFYLGLHEDGNDVNTEGVLIKIQKMP